MSNQERGVIPRKIKGFRDIDPTLNQLKRKIIESASAVYRSYGFEHWDTPALEYADNLGKYLPDEDEDAVGKEVYSFLSPDKEPVYKKDRNKMRDKAGKVVMENPHLALRYDLTAPLARVYSQKYWSEYVGGRLIEGKAPLFRRYQYGPVYRNEMKPGEARFREFWQLDFDTVGSNDIGSDAEIATILVDALEAIGLEKGSFRVKVNNRKLLKGFLASLGVKEEANEQNILRIIDKYDKIGLKAVEQELGAGRTDEVSGSKIAGLNLDQALVSNIYGFLEKFIDQEDTRQAIIQNIGPIDNPLAQEGIEELNKMDAIWNKLGFGENKIVFDPTLVRGMAYYTGPIFEVESLQSYIDDKGKEKKVGSICGGGRYDGLVANLLGGLSVPATGASIGVDRLAALLELTNQGPAQVDGPVFITYFDDELMPEYQSLARELRSSGIETEIYYGSNRGLGKQLGYADSKNSPIAILIGSNEVENGVATIRNLKLGKELSKTITDKKEFRAKTQLEVNRADLVAKIKELLNSEN